MLRLANSWPSPNPPIVCVEQALLLGRTTGFAANNHYLQSSLQAPHSLAGLVLRGTVVTGLWEFSTPPFRRESRDLPLWRVPERPSPSPNPIPSSTDPQGRDHQELASPMFTVSSQLTLPARESSEGPVSLRIPPLPRSNPQSSSSASKPPQRPCGSSLCSSDVAGATLQP